MRPLLLVAAGGLAREVLVASRAAASAADGGRPSYALVDDDPTRWGTEVSGAPVVGGLEEAKSLPDHDVVVCAGRGSVRRDLVARLAALGVGPDRFAAVVHPGVVVPPGCEVGAGSIVLAGCVLTADVRVGRHVVLMPHVTLTHDVVVDDHATLCAGVALGGGVHVGEAAYVGMNASVRQGCRIGAAATLGMGAALLTDLVAGETWVGVPAGPRRPGGRA